MRTIILLTTTALVLGGCDMFNAPANGERASSGPGATSAPAPAAGAFSHSQSEDLSGYYMAGEAQVGPGDFSLTHLFVGQAQEFGDWEAGERSATFAPVMLEFLAPGETTERVLPTSYSVSDDRIRMTGTNANGDRIAFDGQLNAGTLATARRNLGGSEEPAITATIRIGDQSYSGVKLNWYGGD
ncbi:hypothetical protein [Brevundimonas sp. NIBR11]|uniref:hypothetical protein n=1 Tax=Brevundimonas sp. NIBR11 TaxID=3015999 RepID=UPI0022EFE0B0|nr:hypothetical protein [Brevundimonas sp. NIBR11]WGM30690.1 hypothetical protein KKHFBJBL_00920 [Brevundimonas sp. NIBR11]